VLGVPAAPARAAEQHWDLVITMLMDKFSYAAALMEQAREDVQLFRAAGALSKN
jgi:hypothetical protein